MAPPQVTKSDYAWEACRSSWQTMPGSMGLVRFDASGGRSHFSLAGKQARFMCPPRNSAFSIQHAIYVQDYKRVMRRRKMLRKAISPLKAISRCLKKSQYLFVGETHGVDEEKYFVNYMSRLKSMGVKNLAVEIPSKDNAALQYFLKTGKMSKLTCLTRVGLEGSPEFVKLIRTAHKNGIRVVAVDSNNLASSLTLADRKAREQHIAKKLRAIKKGKTLVWIGSYHAAARAKAADAKKYPSANMILRGAGIKTSSIRLESGDRGLLALYPIDSTERKMSSAYYLYYSDRAPRRAVALPTKILGKLVFSRPVSLRSTMVYSKVRYSTAFDYVFFLPTK